MRALLGSDNFGEATAFASRTLHEDPGKRSTMGSLIRSRVEELAQSQQADQLKKALALIDQAKQMNTPLGELYTEQLEDLRRQIDKRLSSMTQPQGGPRSANGVGAPSATRPAVAGGEG